MGSSGRPARFQVRAQARPPAASCPQQEGPRRNAGGHRGSDCKPGSLASVCAQTWPTLLGNFPRPPLSCACCDHVPRPAPLGSTGSPSATAEAWIVQPLGKFWPELQHRMYAFKTQLRRAYSMFFNAHGIRFKFHLVRHTGLHGSLTRDTEGGHEKQLRTATKCKSTLNSTLPL